MLLKRAVLEAVARGEVSLVFRRWRRPTVRAGGSLTTAAGVLAIDEVAIVDEASIGEAEAARAGYPSAAALRAELARRREGAVYRIAVRFAGADPRIALRDRDRLDEAEARALEARLARLDGATPWTARTLALIAANPGRRASELAELLGQETQPFKARVRKLKVLGLTESLEAGYRLSPRGAALARHLG